MKKQVYIWILILTFSLPAFSLNGISQDRKMDRNERKEARKAEQAANFDLISAMVEARTFVLKANYLENKYGDMVTVSSNTNFILVNPGMGVLQTSFNTLAGSNGLGGATAEGTIRSWNIVRNTKNLTYIVRFSLVTNIGIYDVVLTVNSDFKAHAEISGLTPGRVIYNGYLTSVKDAKIFKGRNSI